MGKSFGDAIPKFIVFVSILLLGHFLGRILKKIFLKALQAMSFDDLIKKVNMDVLLNKIKPGLSATSILVKILYWLVMLIFITAAADYVGMTMVTEAIGALFGYIPTLIAALVVLIIGLYIADLVKNVVYTAANSIGISGAKAIASIVYYLLAIMVVVTALKQSGINTDMITTNIAMILGAILLAFAISYGFSSRELVKNILSSYYGRGKYEEGMTIRIGEIEGVIEKIDSISVTISSSNKKIVLPSKMLIEEKIEILS